MSNWTVEYLHQALNDLKKLDHSQRVFVVKAIQKVSNNPLPVSEGGYGKPLGNKGNTDLSGYYKIKLLKLGLRVVYGLVRKHGVMQIIVISVRSDNEVYRIASERI